MSTLFRDKSLFCGIISQIGIENLPIGMIIAKMPGFKGDYFNPELIKRGDVIHGGMITGKEYRNGEWYIRVIQGKTFSDGTGEVDEDWYSASYLEAHGWNVFMWDRRVLPEPYFYLVRDSNDDDFFGTFPEFDF